MCPACGRTKKVGIGGMSAHWSLLAGEYGLLGEAVVRLRNSSGRSFGIRAPWRLSCNPRPIHDRSRQSYRIAVRNPDRARLHRARGIFDSVIMDGVRIRRRGCIASLRTASAVFPPGAISISRVVSTSRVPYLADRPGHHSARHQSVDDSDAIRLLSKGVAMSAVALPRIGFNSTPILDFATRVK